MFETGDYVIYGSTGICKVMGVTTMNMDGIPKDRLYYVLRPNGKQDGTIYTPVDNKKLVIRKVMSKEEAEQLINDIPNIEALEIENDKLREEKYKECLKSCDNREIIRIIKTIYLRRMNRLRHGKKGTSTDERYLKAAEDGLYSELSMQLGIPKENMVDYIKERVGAAEK